VQNNRFGSDDAFASSSEKKKSLTRHALILQFKLQCKCMDHSNHSSHCIDQNSYLFAVTRKDVSDSLNSSSFDCNQSCSSLGSNHPSSCIDSVAWTHGASKEPVTALAGPLQYSSLLEFVEDEHSGGCACCVMRSSKQFKKLQQQAKDAAIGREDPLISLHRSIIDQVLQNVPVGSHGDSESNSDSSSDVDDDAAAAASAADDDSCDIAAENHLSLGSSSSPASASCPSKFQIIFIPMFSSLQLDQIHAQSCSNPHPGAISDTASLYSEFESVLAFCPFTRIVAEGETLIDAVEAWQSKAESSFRRLDAFSFPFEFMRAASIFSSSPNSAGSIYEDFLQHEVKLMKTATDSSSNQSSLWVVSIPISSASDLPSISSSIVMSSTSSIRASFSHASLHDLHRQLQILDPNSSIIHSSSLQLLCSPCMSFNEHGLAVLSSSTCI
jgi:hypothetical protein